MGQTFDPAVLLQRQGWVQGSGLRKGALSRPITGIKRKENTGIGQGTFSTFPWWESIYDKTVSSSDHGNNHGNRVSTTSTGLISPHHHHHLNPTSPHEDSRKHQLYSKFLKGDTIVGYEPIETLKTCSSRTESDEERRQRRDKRGAKRRVKRLGLTGKGIGFVDGDKTLKCSYQDDGKLLDSELDRGQTKLRKSRLSNDGVGQGGDKAKVKTKRKKRKVVESMED